MPDFRAIDVHSAPAFTGPAASLPQKFTVIIPFSRSGKCIPGCKQTQSDEVALIASGLVVIAPIHAIAARCHRRRALFAAGVWAGTTGRPKISRAGSCHYRLVFHATAADRHRGHAPPAGLAVLPAGLVLETKPHPI